jgi:hypothetical protein
VKRQVRFIAQVVEQSTVQVRWNGVLVFNDKVNPTDHQTTIFEWQIDTSLFGLIPMEVHVHTGQIIWSNLHMNYSGVSLPFPGSQPLGFERIASHDFYAPPGLGDLKKNVRINGEPIAIDRQNDEQGAWHYEIRDNQILTCDFYIDRKRTMLYNPRA